MSRNTRLLLLVLLAAICISIGGRPRLAKVALLAGMPDLAERFLVQPDRRGVALYNAGRFEEADLAFQQAGRTATYNRGLSLAATGRYELSVAYFDAVLFAAPEDRAAQENRAIVSELVEPVVGAGSGAGRIAGIVTDAEARQADEDALTQNSEQRRVRKPVGARSLAASDDWLATLADSPGEYLQARLKAEYDRRAASGLTIRGGAFEW